MDQFNHFKTPEEDNEDIEQLEEYIPKTAEVFEYQVEAEDGEIGNLEVVRPVNFDGEHKVVMSCPTYYKEWEQGEILEQMHSLFAQRLDEGQVVEMNYMVNLMTYGDGKDSDQNMKLREGSEGRRQKTNEMLSFLQELVRIQAIAAEKGSDSEEVKLVLDEYEDDPNLFSVLKEGAECAENIRVSYVNLTQMKGKHFEQMGYGKHAVAVGGTMRTIGADYAKMNLKRDDDIFWMFDADTKFGSRKHISNLLHAYRDNPKKQFDLQTLSYHAPDGPNEVVRFAAETNLKRSKSYNAMSSGSPQASMTRNALEELDLIAGPDRRRADADFNLYRRLTDRFIHEGKDNMDSTSDSIMVSPRIDGYLDSNIQIHQLQQRDNSWQGLDHRWQLLATQEQSEEYMHELESLGDPQLSEDMERLRAEYTRQAEKQQKLIRGTAVKYIAALDSGLITLDPSKGVVKVDDSVLSESNLIRRFVNRNEEWLARMKPEDIEYVRYLVTDDTNEWTKQLNPLQRALREWLGVVPDPHDADLKVEKLEEKEDDSWYKDPRNAGDKRSSMVKAVVDAQVVGRLRRMHHKELLELKTQDSGLSDDYKQQLRENFEDPEKNLVKANQKLYDFHGIKSFDERKEWLTQLNSPDE